ncbi:hypothetical protein GOQ27_15125 [Clostridium sp. D2Q-11]|uniref:Uncharacterized protein n=1 Tax=Anaeromonas frigoriresistens TaxID=2683708 RepID=A0A942UXB5_9FIRM|nr:hypothetical protein [Anaeromonas frigoriresistens]MBS4539805.1 hypothetical protein [Anaeromonas frigoriresistens]
MFKIILGIIFIVFIGLIALIEYLRRAFINKHDNDEIKNILSDKEYKDTLSRSIAEYNQSIQGLKEAFRWKKRT